MNRHRIYLVVAFSSALVAGTVFLLPSRSNPHSIQLNIVRKAVEQGKPVVFFRVNGAEKQFMQMGGLCTFEEGKKPERFFKAANGLFGPWYAISPSSRIDPIDDTNRNQREFGVIAPTNLVWRLHAQVYIEDKSLSKRLSGIFGTWRVIGRQSVLDALRGEWKGIHIQTEDIVSDPITNAVTQAPQGTLEK
jgi:hypothetical protein